MNKTRKKCIINVYVVMRISSCGKSKICLGSKWIFSQSQTFNPDQVERQIAQFLVNAVEQALNNSEVPIVEAIRRIWGGESRGRKFSLPSQFGDLSRQLSISFVTGTMDNSNGELSRYPDGSMELQVNLGKLQNARDLQSKQNALRQIEMAIYHETDHIYSSGSDFDSDASDKVQETIRYLSHPGEVKAHAWQYAIYYMRQFPSQPFNLSNMQQLAQQLDNKARAYYISFAQPEKQQQYSQYGNVANIHQNIVSMTQEFVEYLNQRNVGIHPHP